MGPDIVQKWITGFAIFPSVESCSSQLKAYAEQVTTEEDLQTAIFNILDDPKSNEKLLPSICSQLFAYYRCKNETLNRLSLTFLPSLIGIHLITTTKPLQSRKKYSCIETILLGIHNLEVVDEEGQLKKTSFRIPFMSRTSVYHEPSSNISSIQPHLALTEKTLLRMESGSTELNTVTVGPYEEYDRIYAGNRMRIMSVLLKLYHQNMSNLSKQSHQVFCRVALKILRHGNTISQKKPFPGIAERAAIANYSDILTKSPSKIPLSSQFLVDLLNCLYYSMYNGQVDLGLIILDEIYNRACSNLYSDVLLMSCAIKNSFKLETCKPKSESQISSPISSITSSANISKTATTNASFKTRKLPDDIPIVKVLEKESLPAIDEQPNDQRANGIKC